MNGQWIGEYESLLEGQTFGGKIHLNIDDRVDHFQGVAYLFEDPQSPVSIAAFRTSNKDRQFRFRTLGIAAYDYCLWELLSGRVSRINTRREFFLQNGQMSREHGMTDV